MPQHFTWEGLFGRRYPIDFKTVARLPLTIPTSGQSWADVWLLPSAHTLSTERRDSTD